MIYGLLQPSAGEFRWQGEPVVLAGPAAARARGIGMVFQHFSLFEQLTVAENVALGLDNAPLAGLDERVAEVSRSLWPAARSQARGVAALGRRAPAHRDRALPAAGPEAADPRRADLGADPAGGRAAVPHVARAAQGRPRDPLHQPQARGGARAVRHRHHPARRQGDRDLRPARRDRAIARQHDGRRRGRRGAFGRSEEARPAAPGRAQSQLHAGRSARRQARRRHVRARGR